MNETRLYDYQKLLGTTIQIFIQTGCDISKATLAATNLLNADLRGIESHGLARLRNYIQLWKDGRITMNADAQIIHETNSTATIDGNKGVGLIIGTQAMQTAIDKATIAGTGWVAVKNSNHFGIAANYVIQALNEDMIGISMTNASPTTSPTRSKDRMLGTNPISCAFPAGNEAPFLADFATTTVANGKLEMLNRKNESVPHGWVQDKDGLPSHNAAILKDGGALLPLGGYEEMGGYKGYALGGIVDIFSGVLSGASFGPWVPPFPSYLPLPQFMPGDGIGHFFGAMRIDAFQPADVFKERMDLWLKTMRNANTIDSNNTVLIPGDKERKATEERLKNGIPLMKSVAMEFENLCIEFNIPFLN